MNILSKFQLFSSSGLGLTVLWIYFHKPSLNYWINHEAVYRTAPATPGLLKIKYKKVINGLWSQKLQFCLGIGLKFPRRIFLKLFFYFFLATQLFQTCSPTCELNITIERRGNKTLPVFVAAQKNILLPGRGYKEKVLGEIMRNLGVAHCSLGGLANYWKKLFYI